MHICTHTHKKNIYIIHIYRGRERERDVFLVEMFKSMSCLRETSSVGGDRPCMG